MRPRKDVPADLVRPVRLVDAVVPPLPVTPMLLVDVRAAVQAPVQVAVVADCSPARAA
jgi:hypothetical protein